MGVTVYSIIAAVFFYNIALAVLALLRRSRAVQARYVSRLLLFMTLLAGLRLLLPIDLKFALVIRSYKFMPAMKRILTAPLLGSFSLGKLLLLVWAAGIVVSLARDILNQLRFYAFEKHLRLYENEQIMRIASEYPGPYTVKVTSDYPIPFVTGLFKPVIYLPNFELRDDEWRYVFRHETQHIASHDEWKKLFFRLVRALFWWNPLAYLSEADISLLLELECDERVVGNGSTRECEAYCMMLLSLAQHRMMAARPAVSASIAGKVSELQIRIETLCMPASKRSIRLRRVLPPVMVALFLMSYLVILQPAGFPSDEEISSYRPDAAAYDITDGILDSSGNFIVFEDGVYKMYINGEYAFQVEEEFLEDPNFSDLPIINGGN